MKTYEELRREVMFQEKTGIKWVPFFSVPMQRRMETFAAFTFIFIILFAEIISLAIFLAIFVSPNYSLKTVNT
jgi:hypothetical protein